MVVASIWGNAPHEHGGPMPEWESDYHAQACGRAARNYQELLMDAADLPLFASELRDVASLEFGYALFRARLALGWKLRGL